MFKCEKCGLDSALGETQTKIVLATRKKEYLSFQRANGTHDRGGVGTEIVQEISVHDQCAADVRAMIAAATAAEAAAVAAAAEAAASAVRYADQPRHDVPFNGVHA